VPSGKRGEGPDRDIEIEQQDVDGRTQVERQSGVDDVLAGRAPIDETGRCLAPPGQVQRYGVDKRAGDIARLGCGQDDRADVVAFGPAGVGDFDRGAGRDRRRPILRRAPAPP
jgi:hypothetical protein